VAFPESLCERLFCEEAFDAGDGGLVVKVQEVLDYLGSYKASELLPLYHSRAEQKNHAGYIALAHRPNACVFHVELHLSPPLLQVPVVSSTRKF